jgi:hypothetical protein
LKNPGSREAGKVLAVVLTPGLSRSADGGEIKKISISTGTDTIELQLELPKAEYATYRAEVLRSADHGTSDRRSQIRNCKRKNVYYSALVSQSIQT